MRNRAVGEGERNWKKRRTISRRQNQITTKRKKKIIITNIKKKTRRGKETLPTKIISVYEIFEVVWLCACNIHYIYI